MAVVTDSGLVETPPKSPRSRGQVLNAEERVSIMDELVADSQIKRRAVREQAYQTDALMRIADAIEKHNELMASMLAALQVRPQ